MLRLPDGEQWRIAMVNVPVFTDNTPQGFYDRMLASRPQPQTGKPDPQAMADFLAAHPETAAAMKIIKQDPPSAGFADSTYRGLHAFRATNDQGRSTFVRWTAVPAHADEPAQPPRTDDKNGLFDALIGTVARGPISWKLILTLAEPGDPPTIRRCRGRRTARRSTRAPSPSTPSTPKPRKRPRHQFRSARAARRPGRLRGSGAARAVCRLRPIVQPAGPGTQVAQRRRRPRR